MNIITLTGKIASDFDLQELNGKDGHELVKVRFLLAVKRRGGKDAGVDFIRVEAWNQLARNLVRFNTKGSRVAVVGRLRSEFYNRDGGDRGGELRSAVVGANIEFLSAPSQRSETAGNGLSVVKGARK